MISTTLRIAFSYSYSFLSRSYIHIYISVGLSVLTGFCEMLRWEIFPKPVQKNCFSLKWDTKVTLHEDLRTFTTALGTLITKVTNI